MVPYGLPEAIAGAKMARAYMKDHNIRGGWSTAVVVDRALSRGLTVSPGSRGRVVLSDGVRSGWFRGGKTNLNQLLATRCARHKDVASALLRAGGATAPRNLAFEQGAADRAWSWSKSALPVVLKPPYGAHGTNVHVGISDRNEFDHAFGEIEKSGRVLVEEFHAGVEHRVLTVGKKVVAATRRVPAHVVGDGIADIGALIDSTSAARMDSGNPLHRAIKMDESVLRKLRNRGRSLQDVPSAGEVVYLRSVSNTHFGGDAVDATESLEAEEIEFVERASRIIGLQVAGFDVLLPREGNGLRPSIVEVNPYPAFALHHFPIKGEVRDAAGRLLDLMFSRRAQ